MMQSSDDEGTFLNLHEHLYTATKRTHLFWAHQVENCIGAHGVGYASGNRVKQASEFVACDGEQTNIYSNRICVIHRCKTTSTYACTVRGKWCMSRILARPHHDGVCYDEGIYGTHLINITRLPQLTSELTRRTFMYDNRHRYYLRTGIELNIFGDRS